MLMDIFADWQNLRKVLVLNGARRGLRFPNRQVASDFLAFRPIKGCFKTAVREYIRGRVTAITGTLPPLSRPRLLISANSSIPFRSGMLISDSTTSGRIS